VLGLSQGGGPVFLQTAREYCYCYGDEQFGAKFHQVRVGADLHGSGRGSVAKVVADVLTSTF